jgi:hypothetical protein
MIFLVVKYSFKFFSSNFLLNYLFETIFKPKSGLEMNVAEEQAQFCCKSKSEALRKRGKAIQRVNRELDIVSFIRS